MLGVSKVFSAFIDLYSKAFYIPKTALYYQYHYLYQYYSNRPSVLDSGQL